MFSFKRQHGSVTKAVSLLVASSALFAAGAQAAGTARTPLVLTAYSNGVGGKPILEKRYDQALSEIRRYKPQLSMTASAKATNLCVTLTAMRQLTEAKTACTDALKAAKYDKMSNARYTPGSSRQDTAYVAIAYANRAVAYLLSQDVASAQADLERAQALAPNAEFVMQNVAAAAAPRSTIAQLDVITR